jgi:V8-like Glu-specific endopeptidase
MNALLLAGTLFFHICGEDDRQYTNYYDSAFQVSYDWVQRNAEPVAQSGGCSATLIAEKTVITAAHCRLRPGHLVRMAYLQDSDDYPMYEISETLEISGAYLDYAIYELNEDPSEDFEIRQLTEEVPAVGEEVYILGHPKLRRLTITAGPLVGSNGKDAYYQADSQGGSSGSGVLDKDGRMFALHQRGSCLDDPRHLGYNLGTLISKIKTESAIVRELLSISSDALHTSEP